MSDQFSEQWHHFKATTDLDEYDTRWDRLADQGHHVHGEADFVMGYCQPGASVLDAGCGMGRVGIELDRRGLNLLGVDLDDDLLERARTRAPHIPWRQANLAALKLDVAPFDLAIMAGNILPFAKPAERAAVVASVASHVKPGGLLIMGVHLTADWPRPAAYDHWADLAGLTLVERFAGWSSEPWIDNATYQVTVHRTGIEPTE